MKRRLGSVGLLLLLRLSPAAVFPSAAILCRTCEVEDGWVPCSSR